MMYPNKSFSIRPLDTTDAAAVAALLRSQSPEYLRFFYAFGSDETAIVEMLSASRRDVYSGIFWQADLIGVFFLRGWDAGYEVPSWGALIDEKYRGKALLGLTLETLKFICRLSGVSRIMAKTHPDNRAVKNLAQFGFRQTGVEESTGNIIHHLDF